MNEPQNIKDANGAFREGVYMTRRADKDSPNITSEEKQVALSALGAQAAFTGNNWAGRIADEVVAKLEDKGYLR